MRTLLLALQLVIGQDSGRVTAPASDSGLWLRVDSLTRTFLFQWQGAWQKTQDNAPKNTGDDLRNANLRLLALHCHWDQTDTRISKFIIENSVAAHASCPMWYPSDAPPIEDERLGIDAGIRNSVWRVGVSWLRDRLRSQLDSAALQMPGDLDLALLRVRFALDAGDINGAWSVAAECAPDPAQCGLLRGLILQRAGQTAVADSAFLAATQLMSEAERCAWNDVNVLLEPKIREAYERLPCAERADIEARLWWLGDPLFLEPGNERRAEHYARKVQITLLARLGHDERQRFVDRKGGKSTIESLVRYGWPAHMYWAGVQVDIGHGNWLRNHASDTAPPYVVREYTRGRLHTLPLPDALLAPLRALPGHWQLNGPEDDFDWWPVEHYARDRGRIVQLPVGQTVMLRRGVATRFVWAADLDSALLTRPPGDSVRATLFQSRSAADVQNVDTFGGRIGRALITDAMLQAGAALIGVELPGDSTRPAARTRFGADIAEPLSALGGAQALSQPLLFDPSGIATATLDADAAVKRMYGTTTFTKLDRLGVYWEAYGFAAADTVDIEIQMTRLDRPGIFARVAGAVGLADNNRGNVTVRWREEPGSTRAIEIREANVPVQMRSIVIDVSRLARGSYRATVSLRKVQRLAITSDRTFELR
ncbi:MAG: hypothetical protein WEE89_06905 [Gemmatimonadota bacterium]